MIAFVQPYPFDGAGGGARILRSLTTDAPHPFVSVATCPQVHGDLRHNETHIPQRPYFGSFLERANSHLGGILEHAKTLLQPHFERKLERLFLREGVEVVHCIPHGIGFWYAFRVAKKIGLPYVINIHDDLSYNLSKDPLLDQTEQKLGEVWREADHRFVISKPMGLEYDRRYGKRPWSMLTDGVSTFPDHPASRDQSLLRLYFMGSVHLAYKRNFKAIAHALDDIERNQSDLHVEFVIRGGMPFQLPDVSFSVTELGWGTQEDIRTDMESVSMLYFPLPFEPEFSPFAKYSLSTKMITYLASGLPILYHGPRYAAAYKLLDEHDAALLALSDDPDQIAQRVLEPSDSSAGVVQNALALARNVFHIDAQRNRLWSTLDMLMRNNTHAYLQPTNSSAPETAR